MEKKSPRNLLVKVAIVSLICGTLGGGAAGWYVGSFKIGKIDKWLNAAGVINSDLKSNDGLAKNSASSPETNLQEPSIDSVSKVSPSVVSIIVTKQLQQYYNYTGPNSPFDNLFNENSPDGNINIQLTPGNSKTPPPTTEQRIGGGTGFIVGQDGLILTNKHVVADQEAQYSVILNNGKNYDAKVVARDPFNDLAFIKIAAKDLPTAELGDSDKVKIGQSVIAIGYSLGEYSNSVTKGIISGMGRNIVAGDAGQAEKLENVFQTDAAINPGNSGGPLVNLSGQVIGMNTAINQSGQLVGFAIPINVLKSVVENFQKNGRLVRAYLGVRYVPIDQQIKEQNKLSVDYGALIVRGDAADQPAVMPGSPADKSGLTENDIILEVDGIKLNDKDTLSVIISKHQPGDNLTLKVLRQGEVKATQVKLEEYKE